MVVDVNDKIIIRDSKRLLLSRCLVWNIVIKISMETGYSCGNILCVCGELEGLYN